MPRTRLWLNLGDILLILVFEMLLSWFWDFTPDRLPVGLLPTAPSTTAL